MRPIHTQSQAIGSADSIFIRESLLQEKTDHMVRCHVCARRCQLVNGGYGWCRTRQNRGGKLLTLVYGAVSAMQADPIEKKPFYHFYPGSRALTSGGWCCNFGCPWCQNWQIAHVSPPAEMVFVSPDRFVEMTENANCQGTAISYNEPTLSLEWSLDVFRLARERGLYNTYVTNGYMTLEALALLVEAGLDALNVDIKGDAAAVKHWCRGVDVEKVWAISQLARAHGLHLEVTTLVIPTVNDADEILRGIAERICGELGADVPWHLSQYLPAFRFTAPATPRSTLERAWQIGKEAGLEYVYIGNLPGHRYENTYCPVCGSLLIRRLGFEVTVDELWDGQCRACGHVIVGVWRNRRQEQA
jgi:pyruvate formate lyase activating enzyme